MEASGVGLTQDPEERTRQRRADEARSSTEEVPQKPKRPPPPMPPPEEVRRPQPTPQPEEKGSLAEAIRMLEEMEAVEKRRQGLAARNTNA